MIRDPQTRPTTDVLCKVCRSLTIYQLSSDTGSDHLVDIKHLEASAKTCKLCYLILGEVLQIPDLPDPTLSNTFQSVKVLIDDLGLEADEAYPLNLRVEDGLVRPRLLVTQGNNDSGPTWYGLGRYGLRIFSKAESEPALSKQSCADSPTVWTSTPAEETDLAIGCCISPTPDLQRLAILVRHWIDECSRSHAVCSSRVSDEQRPFPTRILDVGSVGSTITLLHSVGMSGRYVALSYCWGNTQSFKTTKATLSSHMRSIDTMNLPRTLQDAVSVTRSLSVRYLWIDSLAIVQDDADDWKREAAKMGDVFANAYLNIAASRSTSSNSGFLDTRAEDPTVEIHPNNSTPFCIGCRHIFANDINKTALTERAWVMQERVLSRRTLHFTSTQLYWECWTRHQGEDLDDKHLGVFKIDAYPRMLSPGDLGSDDHDSRVRRHQTPRHWWHLLSSYTAAKLTFPTDRLIAISGLMNRISQATGQTSVAGIFRDRLYAGLLWSATDRPLSRLTGLQAPSWSWVGFTGPINHIQLYEYATNDDEVYLDEPCTDANASLTAICRELRRDLAFTDLKHSREYSHFPPELDYLPTNFRFISPDWKSDDDDLGWLTIDDDNGSSRDWNGLGWVVVACVADNEDNDDLLAEDNKQQSFEKGPFYCLVVEHISGHIFRRAGVAAVKKMDWFVKGSERKIVIT